MIHFEVLGKVKGKGRPRFARHGNFVKSYTDADTVNYENLVKLSFLNSGCEAFSEDKQLRAEIDIYISIPKAVSKKKRQEMMLGNIRPTKKPDIDNILKSLFDGLNKVAFNDDTQIVEVKARKYYGEQEKVVINIFDILE